MQIEIRGNTDLRKAMRRFMPEVEKQLRKELKTALNPVAKMARSFAPADSPMSGWAGRSFSEGRFPTYNRKTIQDGIKLYTTVGKAKNGYTSMARLENQSAVGAIYETAGRRGSDGQEWVGPKAGGSGKGVSRSVNPKAGAQFIKNLPQLTLSQLGSGRLIYRAWSQNKGVALGSAKKAISKATAAFYAQAAKKEFGTRT